MIKLGVIFGGESVEHEVSIISAVQAMNKMDNTKYEIIPIYITKDKEWYKKIPEKYRTKYKKLGIKEWNKFAEEHEGEYEGQWLYKKNGLQVLGIPSNATIPEWCQPFIDYSTIVNNIIAPFIPVLEIFQSKTIEEGKTRKGVNRKTKSFSNVVKF